MRVLENLNNQTGSYILPFFWQHGESEEVLREYVNAIKNANISELCLEARPHPDFAGEQWMNDVAIILDEAKKLDMKIWILDDAHFPSGQAAGKMGEQPDHLQKTYLNYNLVDVTGPTKQVTVDIEPMAHYYNSPFKGGSHPFIKPDTREYTDPEKLIAVVAGRLDGQAGDIYHMSDLIDLTEQVKDGVLVWDVPAGSYRLMVIYETHKGGGRGGSINFLSKASCKVQVENCYEPHFKRFGDEFGKTILGFFSDEPEIGNVANYSAGAGKIGNPDMPLPWSEELPAMMEARFGKDYATKLVALWFNVGSKEDTADMRVGYMDIVTRLCQKNFGEQMGNWCREHGVKYIGHIVEDCNASTGLASSQGHYFRALWGQDWSGVDNIGGQVTIGGANKSHAGFTGIGSDGEFYHHELAKLGTSLADIDPKKQGITMCETFGAYGWDEGTRLMKYQADHLLVRGINRYVPHAFSPKAFPDFDCPPHFYAHGKNPLYKPFGTLMNYLNRVSHLIDGGKHEVNVAILYHAESEWAGMEFVEMGKVARELDNVQIDFDFIPADVFGCPQDFNASFDADGLHINGHTFDTFVIPGLEYVTPETVAFLEKAKDTDLLVVCVNRVPSGMEDIYAATPLEEVGKKLVEEGKTDVKLSPANTDIQVYHYAQDSEDYYLISNESADEIYEGIVTIPQSYDSLYQYDAFSNCMYKLEAEMAEVSKLNITLAPYEMLIVVAPKTEVASQAMAKASMVMPAAGNAVAKDISSDWKVSYCLNENYPAFEDVMEMTELKNINLVKKKWSGVVRYEKSVAVDAELAKTCELSLEDAYESVEVWVNDQYIGERICPPYTFNVAGVLTEGDNVIRMECRTTLERLVHGITGGMSPFGPEFGAIKPSGIIGSVILKK